MKTKTKMKTLNKLTKAELLQKLSDMSVLTHSTFKNTFKIIDSHKGQTIGSIPGDMLADEIRKEIDCFYLREESRILCK